MNRSRYIASPVYLVALLLILFPMFDAFVDVWPVRAGQVDWRYGAAGTFSGAIMTPTFGLVVMFVIAALAGHRVVQRIIAGLSLIASLVLTAAALLFVLDALQVRAEVRAEAMTPFTVVSIAALTKIALTAVVMTVLAVASWRSSRSESKRGTGPRAPQREDMLIG